MSKMMFAVPPLEVPQAFNGYVTVARPAERIMAKDVRVGDVLLVDGYVTQVAYITPITTAPMGCTGFHFAGTLNVIRGWHELVSVIRTEPDPS
jgi:hypothetical protein